MLYVSERLIEEVPNSLRNFLVYLWNTCCENDKECLFLIQPMGGESRLSITICSTGKTIIKDFGTPLNAEIIISPKGSDLYMSYKD